MANDFNSVLATCKRFQDIATWDPEHFNANGALARIAELHKHELAAKDAEIDSLKRTLRTAARWIMAHDIYGHMGSEILEDAKKLLNDDGRFLG